MFLVKICVLTTLTIFGVFCAEDDVENTDARERREYIPEAWRAIEDKVDMSGWIPQDSSTESQEVSAIPVIKRRRLRRRKKRPPHISLSEENTGDTDIIITTKRRFRPLKLAQSDEVWIDMEKENPKQTNRRRVIPKYNPSEESDEEQKSETSTEEHTESSEDISHSTESIEIEEPIKSHEKIRDPFDALKEAEEKQKTPKEIKQFALLPDLRTLLKKTVGSISLSEILQKKNLSLSELLRGNTNAISALTEPTIETTVTTTTQATTTHKKIQSERKKMTNRVYTSEEKIDLQNKRLALLNDHKINKVYMGITHTFEVVTEPITEARIFVPAKQSITTQNAETTMPSTTQMPRTSESESSNTVVPQKTFKLPITSAKLMSRTSIKPPTIRPKILMQPIKPLKITVQEESSIKIADKPMKITLDLTKNNEDTKSDESGIVTAREEILQMLKDPFYKERLSRILQERNMTMQELVAQRERGSSQLHLADIFHNKTREPEPIEEPYVGVIKTEFPKKSREQKSRKLESTTEKIEEATYPRSTETVQQDVIIPLIPPIPQQIPNFNNTFNYAAIMPFWKQFHPAMFKQFYQNENSKPWHDIHPFEDSDNRISDHRNNKLSIDMHPRNYHLDEESLFDIPTGVKSALVASFAIVGLSIIMFLTIFVIFKWTQRKKNKVNYISSLSGAKIKAPILEIPHRSALKNFMCETLGRKTNFYKSHMQSMSDVWDDRKQKF